MYRKIYAAELPIGYQIGNAIPSRSTRAFNSNQEVKGGGLVSLSIPESLVSLCIRAWPVAPPMSNGGPFVVWQLLLAYTINVS